MFGFYRIINLVPALRAIISEESLIPKNNQNKVPFLFKTLKLLLFVKKNKNTDLSKTLRKLGPTWIKLGQFLSTRPDIIGKDLSDKLKNLQDKVEPFSITKAKEILQNEFKEDYEDIFIEIMPSEAAASNLRSISILRLSAKVLTTSTTLSLFASLENFSIILAVTKKFLKSLFISLSIFGLKIFTATSYFSLFNFTFPL